MMTTCPKAWLSLILIVVVALLPDMAIKIVKRYFFPAPWERVLVLEEKKRL
jgi:hypothetical protein